MTPTLEGRSQGFRSVFISDVHLGSRGCRAELLLDFLARVESQHLFLVGDIVDLESLSKTLYWPRTHTDVLRVILDKARRGTRVIYVPGNHDELLRDFAGHAFGNVEIHREHIHVAADGRTILVLHGDEFDSVVRTRSLLNLIGSHSYNLLLWLNAMLNQGGRRFGFPYWPLARRVKQRINRAVSYIARFEEAAVRAATSRRVDAIVCGHIHRAAKRRVGDVLYCNDGDWVESC